MKHKIWNTRGNAKKNNLSAAEFYPESGNMGYLVSFNVNNKINIYPGSKSKNPNQVIKKFVGYAKIERKSDFSNSRFYMLLRLDKKRNIFYRNPLKNNWSLQTGDIDLIVNGEFSDYRQKLSEAAKKDGVMLSEAHLRLFEGIEKKLMDIYRRY